MHVAEFTKSNGRDIQAVPPRRLSLYAGTLVPGCHGTHYFTPNSPWVHTDFTRSCDTRLMSKNSLLPVLLVPSCILMVPASSMLLQVEGWAWGVADFLVMWTLIAGVILTYQLVMSKASRGYRVAAGLTLTTGLLLIWVNGAVGLIGNEDNPANVMYGGVLLVGLIGAVMARLEPVGMAVTLFAMAVAQFMVPVVALMLWPGDFSPGVLPVFGLNGAFVLACMVSGVLFWRVGRKGGGTSKEASA
jgi:hypothetical protein